MKLQIVEIRGFDCLCGEQCYRYVLQLDEWWLVRLVSDKKKQVKQIYGTLMSKLIDCSTDLDLEHSIRCSEIPGIDSEVIFEQEVQDTFIKELKIKKRLKDIQKDFV